MRGSVARLLRKEVGFDPNKERSYQTIDLMVKKPIQQFGVDPDTNKPFINIVYRDVQAQLVECIDGSRKVYQYMKRKWNNPDYETELNQLPSQQEQQELEDQILNDEEVKKKAEDKRWADRQAKWDHDKKQRAKKLAKEEEKLHPKDRS